MGRGKTFFKNTIILMLGKISTQIITFLLLPLYTAYLSTSEYGTVDLLNTLVSLLLPIITIQIEQAVFRELIDCRNNEKKQNNVISTSFCFLLIQCFIYTLLFAVVYQFIDNNYKIYLLLNVIIYVFSSLLQQIARGFGKNNVYALSCFLCGIMTIIANIILIVILKFKVEGMLISTFLGQLICCIYIFIDLKLYRFISIKYIEKFIFKKMFKYSMPLVPNAISWWIFNASDRVIVSTILGINKNGILAAAHKFPSAYISIFTIFNLSWTETIAMHINDKDFKEFFSKFFNILLRFFVSIAIIIISVMPFAYRILISNNYFEGYYQVPIMMIGAIFNMIIGLISTIYVAKKDTKAIANTSIISAINNICINLLLINFVGLYAATISTFMAYFVMSIYRIIDVRKKYFKIEFEKKFIIQTIIILLIIIPIYYYNNIFLNIFSIITTSICCIILNKGSIKIILNMLKSKIENKKENVVL